MSSFSANLRAEMARQGLAQYENVLTDVLSSRLHLDPERLWDIFCATSEDPIPTPDEITAIANALGVPESRLTVSREDLEAEVERLRASVVELRYCLESVLEIYLPECDEGSRWDRKTQAALADHGLVYNVELGTVEEAAL